MGASLSQRFLDSYPEFAVMRLTEADGGLDLGGEFTIKFDGERWTLRTEEAHGHFESFEEASALAVRALRGEARFAAEFRVEDLAATWIETREGDGIDVRHLALFLSPFDADEWQLREGEQWRQIRTMYHLDAETGLVEKASRERLTTEGEGARSDTVNWLERGLGPAADGLRWTQAKDVRLVFQAPSGWRKVIPVDREQNWIDFATSDGHHILRVRTYYRANPSPPSEPFSYASSPYSIEQTGGSDDPSWQMRGLNLTFSDGVQDILAMIELFSQPGDEVAAERIYAMLEETAPSALYAPNEWDMKRPD